MTERWTSEDGAIELRLGRWEEALADVGRVDCVCADPPYGEGTHDGNDSMGRFAEDGAERRDLAYDHWTPEDVHAFGASWSKRCVGWIAAFTSDDLCTSYRDAYRRSGRLDFAPVPVIQHRPRLGGDGPGSCAVYLMAARPRERRFLGWGSLPGWYLSRVEVGGVVSGAKPLDLMRAIIRDYSRPGDLICDPCAGGATTLLAARMEGRRAIGAEMDPDTYRKAVERLEKACRQRDLFSPRELVRAEQSALALGDDDAA